MTIDWQAFSITGALTSFSGGLIIGLASIWLALANGKIAGISGILGGFIDDFIYKRSKIFNWQTSFLIGLIIAPSTWLIFSPLPPSIYTTKPITLLLGGILVGLGTRLANGCTSGHGICGLSRLSFNSLIAVLSFMTSGAISVYLIKYIIGL